MDELTLSCAGTIVPDARDRIRRYCGLPWSGGGGEAWAYRYYDAVPGPTGPRANDTIAPIDVITCAALHPGITGTELAYFGSEAAAEVEWRALRQYPVGVPLAEASPRDLTFLRGLPQLVDGIGLSLLTKVLHRKRPEFVPIFDKRIVDAYRPLTGLRGVEAWPALVDAMREDLADPENHQFLDDIQGELRPVLTGPVPSHLRLLDIAVWMGGVRRDG